MKLATKVMISVGAAIAVLAGTNHVLLHVDPPLAAAQAQATRLGWPAEDRVPVAGGYDSRFLARTAFVRFRSRSQPELGEVHVEVAQHSPFAEWILTEVQVESAVEPR